MLDEEKLVLIRKTDVLDLIFAEYLSYLPFIVLSVDFDLLKCQDSINLHQSELLRYFIHNTYHDHEA